MPRTAVLTLELAEAMRDLVRAELGSLGVDRGRTLRRQQRHRTVVPASWFYGRLLTATLVGVYRWEYTFEEVTLADSGSGVTIEAKDGGRSGTVWNLREVTHTATWAWDQNVGLLPDGFHVQPIGGGYVSEADPSAMRTNPTVRISPHASLDGSRFYTMSELGVIDGQCQS